MVIKKLFLNEVWPNLKKSKPKIIEISNICTKNNNAYLISAQNEKVSKKTLNYTNTNKKKLIHTEKVVNKDREMASLLIF